MTRLRQALRVAAFLCLPWTAPAFAMDDHWPALFDVVNVEASDVLNVRSMPSADAEIIGQLDASATNVEVIRPNDPKTWGKVNVGERSGWVSLSFLERQPGQSTRAPIDVRQCFGTEPFWALSYDAPRIELTAPDIDPRAGLISGLFTSKGRRDRFAYAGSFFPSAAGNRDITMSVRLEACSDGMSDREYAIGVDMLITRPDAAGDDSMTGLYSGCCSLSPPPAE